MLKESLSIKLIFLKPVESLSERTFISMLLLTEKLMLPCLPVLGTPYMLCEKGE